MAFSGIVASTVAAFFIFSVVNGQFNPTNSIPGCNARNVAAGNYFSPHPNYCELYLKCDTGLNQHQMVCPKGLLFDSRISNCNWPNQAICPSWPCDNNRVGARYPSTCCSDYYECTGSGFIQRSCAAGLSFNAQTGQCQGGACTNQKECIVYGTNQPTVDPRVNCSLVADPNGNPCLFRMRVEGTLSEPFQCAEGTAFNANACTCTDSTACFRDTNATLNKVQDPQCRASFRAEFGNNARVTVFSDKIASTPTALRDFVESRGVQFSNNLATFSSNPQTGAEPYLYSYSQSNNQLAVNYVATWVFRANRNGPFQVVSNDLENSCTPTLEGNATFTGNSYQISFRVTGFTQTTVNTQATNTATITATINAGTNDWVECSFYFNTTASIQLINRGPTGAANNQVVNSNLSPILGTNLAYNLCGFRVGHGFSGEFQKIVYREACSDFSRVRL